MNMDVFHFDLEQGGLAGAAINAAKSILLDQIRKPIEAMINEVNGGRWKGQGAQRFVQEMSGGMFNGLNGMDNNLNDFAGGIQKAISIFSQGENQATQTVNKIESIFSDL